MDLTQLSLAWISWHSMNSSGSARTQSWQLVRAYLLRRVIQLSNDRLVETAGLHGLQQLMLSDSSLVRRICSAALIFW